jgi:hypothetical protein
MRHCISDINFEYSSRRVRLAAVVIVALFGACARYEYVNELDVPGLCPSEDERRIARERVPPIGYERVAGPATDSLRGRIVESDPTGDEITSRPVPSAQVHLLGSDRAVLTDSVGRFAIALPSENPVVLRSLGLGYWTRVDTLRIPLSAETGVLIALRPMVLDGPCSGLSAVRVRKPWWKWW